MSSKKNPVVSWKLYCIIDEKVTRGKDPVKLAGILFKKGVDAVQLRFKNMPSYRLIPIARKIMHLARKYKCALIINDRPDVMLASGATGVHLGKGDMSPRDFGTLLRPGNLIGRTVHSKKEAGELSYKDLNYIGAGPVFPTPVKHKLKSQGVDFIAKVKDLAQVPVFAIGGINHKNLEQILLSGADGICVTRATDEVGILLKTINQFKKPIS